MLPEKHDALLREQQFLNLAHAGAAAALTARPHIEADQAEAPESDGVEHRAASLADSLLSFGSACLELMQYYDALRALEAAAYLNPDSTEIAYLRNRAYCKLVPRWHFAMLNDEARNRAFEKALSKVVTPDSVVLDIGAGSALLSMLAVRCGARYAVSCEMNPIIADLARKTVELNGYADRIKVINKKSTGLDLEVDFEEPPNLLVTETADCGLLGEGIMPSIEHAREKLLAPNATIIPREAAVYAVLMESPQMHGLNRVDRALGFDVSPFNEFKTFEYFPLRLKGFDHTELSEPFLVFRFDFTDGLVEPAKITIPVDITRSGVCHSVVFWFELRLDEEISITNHVCAYSHWTQAMVCLGRGVPLTKGTRAAVIAEHRRTGINFDMLEPNG